VRGKSLFFPGGGESSAGLMPHPATEASVRQKNRTVNLMQASLYCGGPLLLYAFAESLSMAVKRQFLFFIFVAALLASYGAVRMAREARAPDLPGLPAVYFYDKSGQKKTLEDFKGKVVLVNLWATWCPPCIGELPSLSKLQEMFPPEKLEIVALSLDTKDPGNFLHEKGARNLKSYWDKDKQVSLKWKYSGLPTSFLLDERGNTVARFDGPYEWDKDPALEKIRRTTSK
jgi:thiol-disulfide isomerase/thioredoxin